MAHVNRHFLFQVAAVSLIFFIGKNEGKEEASLPLQPIRFQCFPVIGTDPPIPVTYQQRKTKQDRSPCQVKSIRALISSRHYTRTLTDVWQVNFFSVDSFTLPYTALATQTGIMHVSSNSVMSHELQAHKPDQNQNWTGKTIYYFRTTIDMCTKVLFRKGTGANLNWKKLCSKENQHKNYQ